MSTELLRFPQHQRATCLGFSCTIPVPAQFLDGGSAQDSRPQGALWLCLAVCDNSSCFLPIPEVQIFRVCRQGLGTLGGEECWLAQG